MSRYPWFRVYNEILTERKIERIGRMTHLPRVIIRGAWMTLMAMANDSPERGYLMWTDDLWITEQEIADDLEMDLDEFLTLLNAFIKMQMVTRREDGLLYCTNFSKRQFSSDHSTPRVRRYRERQKKQAQETDDCNVTETLHSNGPEADTETEAEAEAERPTRPRSGPPSEHPAVSAYEEKAQQGMNTAQRKEVIGLVGVTPENVTRWRKVVHGWMMMGWNPRNVNGMLDYYQRSEIPGQDRKTGPPGDNGTGPPKDPVIVKDFHRDPDYLMLPEEQGDG